MADDFIAADLEELSGNSKLSLSSKEHRKWKLEKSAEDNRNDPLESITTNECRQRYRFKPTTIRMIADEIADDIGHYTCRSFSLSPLLQLMITLRFLASGAFYSVIGDTLGVSPPSVCRVVKIVMRAICNKFGYIVCLPNRQALSNVKEAFKLMAGLPNIIGCVDGTFVRIRRQHENSDEFICRKGYAAMNVQVAIVHFVTHMYSKFCSCVSFGSILTLIPK